MSSECPFHNLGAPKAKFHYEFYGTTKVNRSTKGVILQTKKTHKNGS